MKNEKLNKLSEAELTTIIELIERELDHDNFNKIYIKKLEKLYSKVNKIWIEKK